MLLLVLAAALLAGCGSTPAAQEAGPSLARSADSGGHVGPSVTASAVEPAADAPWKMSTVKTRFRGDVGLNRRELAKAAFDPFPSPDGKTILYSTDPGRANEATWVLGRSTPIAGRVWFHRSAFAADGSSVLLVLASAPKSSQTGFVVLALPSLEEIFRSEAGREPVYTSARTIAFRDGAVPMKVDLTERKAVPVGKSLHDFGCVDFDARQWGTAREPCNGSRWTTVLHVSADHHRWLLADYAQPSSGNLRLSAIRVADATTATSSSLFDGTGDATLLMSRARKRLCVFHRPSGKWKVACARVGEPFSDLFESTCAPKSTWAGDDALVITMPSATGCTDQPELRVWNFLRHEATEFDFFDPNSLHPLPGGRWVLNKMVEIFDIETGDRWVLKRGMAGSATSAMPDFFDVDPEDATHPEAAVLYRMTFR